VDKDTKALVDKIDAQVDQARLEIERLEAKGREAEADKRREIQDQIQQLKHKRNDAAEKLDELKNSGEHALEDLRAGAEHAWKSLSSAAKSAADRFR